jgi:hypothetical protein
MGFQIRIVRVAGQLHAVCRQAQALDRAFSKII